MTYSTNTNNLPENYLPVLDKGYVGLVNVMGTDIDVVNAARVSYDKQSKLSATNELESRDSNLLQYLWREGHTSPFRHATLSFEVYAPLMVARQHWKYAVASTFVDDQNGWNESSRRYVTEVPTFYIPDNWRKTPENLKQGSGEYFEQHESELISSRLRAHIINSMNLYELAMGEGIAPEMARLFLPAYGMYVRYRWTVSLHGVMHFISQRREHTAQEEIQSYASAVFELTKLKFPACMELLNG